jgi:hypothetical protein
MEQDRQLTVEEAHTNVLLSVALDRLREEQAAATRLPADRYRSIAITKLEEALLWLKAEDTL